MTCLVHLASRDDKRATLPHFMDCQCAELGVFTSLGSEKAVVLVDPVNTRALCLQTFIQYVIKIVQRQRTLIKRFHYPLSIILIYSNFIVNML